MYVTAVREAMSSQYVLHETKKLWLGLMQRLRNKHLPDPWSDAEVLKHIERIIINENSGGCKEIELLIAVITAVHRSFEETRKDLLEGAGMQTGSVDITTTELIEEKIDRLIHNHPNLNNLEYDYPLSAGVFRSPKIKKIYLLEMLN